MQKKNNCVHFCGRCHIIRRDIDLRSWFCTVLVRELYNVKDFCLIINFLEYWSFIMAGNKYNLAYQEHIIKVYKKGAKQTKKLPPSTPLQVN